MKKTRSTATNTRKTKCMSTNTTTRIETKRDLVAATRAEILARLIYGEPADEAAHRAHAQVERMTQAAGCHRQRAILWLNHILKHEAVTHPMPVVLGFDTRLVEAADTLGVRHRESLREYAKRLAACNDADLLAVAVIAIDDQIGEGIENPEHTPAAYKRARRVLKRAADALANQQPGETPPAGGAVDNLPTAPALRNALEALVGHTNGAQDAMMEMMRGPGNVPWEVTARLASEDVGLLVINLHDLMRVVAMLIIDLTVRGDETTYEDRMTLVESRTKGVTLMQGMETMAQTIARRLRSFNESHRESHQDEVPENGKVH